MRQTARTDNQKQTAQSGFSLLELLVVMAIMALLVGFVAPKVMGYLGAAKVTASKVQMQNIVSALELYRLDVGHYPSQSDGLVALVTAPAGAKGWSGPYLAKASGLKDAWGEPYLYKLPGEHGEFDIVSLGADNQSGGEDEDADLGNW
jgi:general secretion pathway protein G